jgi:hypothetical protein
MPQTLLYGFARGTCTAIAVLLLAPALSPAQDVTGPALKASYIYNFAKFTEWPADVVAAEAPFVMCVLGDAAVGDALAQVVKGRALAGHSLTVSSVTRTGPQSGCHVLYVSGVTAAQAAQLVAGLRDAPVLTISDVETFTELGGIAQLFFEYGRLSFTIHHEAAMRARLQISSRLLALAKRQ